MGKGQGEGMGKGSKGTDRDRAMPLRCVQYLFLRVCDVLRGPSDPVACSSLIKVPHNSTTHN